MAAKKFSERTTTSGEGVEFRPPTQAPVTPSNSKHYVGIDHVPDDAEITRMAEAMADIILGERARNARKGSPNA
jgi:hypothetical protein